MPWHLSRNGSKRAVRDAVVTTVASVPFAKKTVRGRIVTDKRRTGGTMDEVVEALKRARVLHQLKPQEAEKEYKSIIAQGRSEPLPLYAACLHPLVVARARCTAMMWRVGRAFAILADH
eukprot:747822-Hanusia_phi.AAC.5